MTDHPAKLSATRVRMSVAGLAFLVTVAIPICGQIRSQPADTTNPERIREQEMSKREYQLRNLGTPEKTTSDPAHTKALGDQVDQDFKRILTLHNEFARQLSAKGVLDYGFVSDAAAEIKKRASRLQTTLAIAKPEGDEWDQQKRVMLQNTRIKDELIVLCKEIESFVNNPIIATPGTIDAQQLMRVRRDLEGIIEVSDSVKKSADKLKKTAP